MRIRLGSHEMTLSGAGENLGAALTAVGIPLDLRCSGKGICNRCEVILLAGEFVVDGRPVSVRETPVRAKACRTVVSDEAAVIEIPRKSLAGSNPKCTETFETGEFPLAPECAGIAAIMDIGTTTVALALADTSTGKIIGSTSEYNKQFKYGDNVVSRISFSTERPANMALLRRALIEENINPMLAGLCLAHNLDIADIKIFSAAGNTVMTHILWNLSPAGMGAIPFKPATRIFPELPAARLGISAAPEAIIKAVPAISGFVGGDITAGITTSKMAGECRCALLVDVGTNCETVLLRDGKFYACAAAAGPAFEGAGVACGSRGEQGAIESIKIDRSLTIHCQVIGGGEPHGVCGSGMIDFVAEARACGLLNEFGRFDRDWLQRSGRYLQLADNLTACKLTADGSIYLSEKDIESILKAKAAIFAGIKSLTGLEGCRVEEVDCIYLAGGFARYIDIENAIRIGMLPDIPPEKYRKIGNSSLAGAALHVLNRDTGKKYLELISKVNDIILNTVPEFETNYIDALMLP
ncbi:MAG: ASKHA domain-containing protein [Victivallaceae bacterium]|nr:ASKHA domain-containing protein [Victivallaceae bacterium]